MVQVVVLDHNIGGTIFCHHCIRKFSCFELSPLIGISNCNSPTVYLIQRTVSNLDIIISCNSCFAFIRWLCNDEIDTTVCHMLVINVSCYIMDIKIIQYDMIYCSIILCNSGNTGSVHCVCVIIRFTCFSICGTLSVICQLQTIDLNILCIFNQDTGGYSTFPFMVHIVQTSTIVQLPLSMTICINLWSISLSISRYLHRCFCSTAVLFCKRKSLILKHRSLFQKNCVSRLKVKLIYFAKCPERLVFCCSIIAIVSPLGINIICCSICGISLSLNRYCRHH